MNIPTIQNKQLINETAQKNKIGVSLALEW